MVLDDETCFRACQGRDPRFDGTFFTGVTSTGIYCRPSCPATTPRRLHMVFFPSAAAAQGAGYRACKRCRPDAAPGSPEWNQRADVVGRAMRLIGDGFVDRFGVNALAAHLGYSSRQLHRQLRSELGAGPLALARSRRAETARLLLESSDLAVSSVCFAAGFSSIRQFNDTITAIYASTPSGLRGAARRRAPDPSRGAARRRAPDPSRATLSLRLAYRAPIELAELLEFLSTRAIPGVEENDGALYRRVLRLPHDLAVVSLAWPPAGSAQEREIVAELAVNDLRDLTAAVSGCRRLLDLDADPLAVSSTLSGDPLLSDEVTAHPGRRVPGSVDAAEIAVRAVLGQQVSLKSAAAIGARLAERFGRTLAVPDGALRVAFPDVDTLAGVSVSDLPLPETRGRALLQLCGALAAGDIVLDPGSDRDHVEHQLRSLAGIGPWTAAYIRMRALSDPDAFLANDLGLRRSLQELGVSADERAALARAESWRPWRAYALMHLWSRRSTQTAARRDPGGVARHEELREEMPGGKPAPNEPATTAEKGPRDLLTMKGAP